MVILNSWQQKHLEEWCKNLTEEEKHKPIEIILLAKDFLKYKQTIEKK